MDLMDDIPKLEAEVKDLRDKVAKARQHRQQMDAQGVPQSQYVDLLRRYEKDLAQKEQKLTKFRERDQKLLRDGRFKEVSQKFDDRRAGQEPPKVHSPIVRKLIAVVFWGGIIAFVVFCFQRYGGR